MKYILLQPIRNLVFAGLVLPNLLAPVSQEKLSRVLPLVVPKQEQILVQKDAKPEFEVKLDLNSVAPVVVEEQLVKITWAKSNYDLKKTQPVFAGVKQEPEPSFESKRALVREIAEDKGIDPKLLEAVWQVESGKSWNTSKKSGAGATGPAQFMSGTFRKYGEDYDADGQVNITSAHDSLAAAANLLIANGAKDGDLKRALLAYNHADWYVKKVLKVADSIQY